MTRRRQRNLGRALLPALMIVVAGGCDQPAMTNQPKLETYESSRYFPDGQAALPRVPGTVARSDNIRPAPTQIPVPITLALLERGREHYDIFCSPCHGLTGEGNGMIVRRGFPAPPSLHSERLRQARLHHFYQVATEGYGVMYSYANRVRPADRWAIAAYIQALQLSQHAPPQALPENILPPGQPTASARAEP